MAKGPSIPEPFLRMYSFVSILVKTLNLHISFEAPPVRGTRFEISPLIFASRSLFCSALESVSVI